MVTITQRIPVVLLSGASLSSVAGSVVSSTGPVLRITAAIEYRLATHLTSGCVSKTCCLAGQYLCHRTSV
jgi:hypothetical protein